MNSTKKKMGQFSWIGGSSKLVIPIKNTSTYIVYKVGLWALEIRNVLVETQTP